MRKTVLAIALTTSITPAMASDDGLYGTFTLGRAEYPFHAFDQVSMPNVEHNQTTAYAFGVGYKRNRVAGELTYYDFGSISSYGTYAAERPELDYTHVSPALAGSGSAKGLSLSVMYYLSDYLYVKVGSIHAKANWTVACPPVAGHPNVRWQDPTIDNYSFYGLGYYLRHDVRVEYSEFKIQPHGDSAYGSVRLVGVTFLF